MSNPETSGKKGKRERERERKKNPPDPLPSCPPVSSGAARDLPLYLRSRATRSNSSTSAYPHGTVTPAVDTRRRRQPLPEPTPVSPLGRGHSRRTRDRSASSARRPVRSGRPTPTAAPRSSRHRRCGARPGPQPAAPCCCSGCRIRIAFHVRRVHRHAKIEQLPDPAGAADAGELRQHVAATLPQLGDQLRFDLGDRADGSRVVARAGRRQPIEAMEIDRDPASRQRLQHVPPRPRRAASATPVCPSAASVASAPWASSRSIWSSALSRRIACAAPSSATVSGDWDRHRGGAAARGRRNRASRPCAAASSRGCRRSAFRCLRAASTRGCRKSRASGTEPRRRSDRHRGRAARASARDGERCRRRRTARSPRSGLAGDHPRRNQCSRWRRRRAEPRRRGRSRRPVPDRDEDIWRSKDGSARPSRTVHWLPLLPHDRSSAKKWPARRRRRRESPRRGCRCRRSPGAQPGWLERRRACPTRGCCRRGTDAALMNAVRQPRSSLT